MRGVFLALQKKRSLFICGRAASHVSQAWLFTSLSVTCICGANIDAHIPRQEQPCAPPCSGNSRGGMDEREPSVVSGGRRSVRVLEGGPQLASNPATIRALRAGLCLTHGSWPSHNRRSKCGTIFSHQRRSL